MERRGRTEHETRDKNMEERERKCDSERERLPEVEEAREVQVLFQEDGIPSTSTYLRYLGTLPHLYQLTVCFRLHLLQARQEILIISYAHENYDNELYLGLSYEKQEVSVVCCQHRWSLDVGVTLRLRRWSSFCLAVDLHTRKTHVVQDGLLQGGHEGTLVAGGGEVRVAGGGTLFVGQEQDSPGGGFNEFQSLRGSVGDLRVYGEVLPLEQMKALTACQAPNALEEPLIDFSNVTGDFEVSDATLLEAPPPCDLRGEAFHVVFPEPRLFREAQQLCHVLGGAMAVPRNASENAALFQLAAATAAGCGDGTGDTLWLGVQGSPEQQAWLDVASATPVNYTNYDQRRGMTIEQPEVCVAFKGTRAVVGASRGSWVPRRCDLERCAACHFHALPIVRVRGLCAKSEFDKEYFLLAGGGEVAFSGVYYSLLAKLPPAANDSGVGDFGAWRLTRYDKPQVTATLARTSPTHYPLGLNTWTFANDVCGRGEARLRVTSCGMGEFSCDDGSCVGLTRRCDMEVNCPDGSDEAGCSVLRLPAGYNKMAPPPRPRPGSPVPVALHVTMLSVRAFDLTGFKFVCELEVRLSWHDARVTLRHLHRQETLNAVHLREEHAPWMPQMEFFGDAYTTSDVEERRSLLLARRASDPLPDDEENLWEDEVFAGSDNPLVLLNKLTVTTSCQFDLITFPFDTQTCRLGVVLLGMTKEYIALVPEDSGVTYLGKRKLLEYYLQSEKMVPYDEGKYSGQAVELTFRNLSTFYITSTYVPTFIIVVIGYLVFFFPLDDFNERIMVALTALLVEAAFFTQMSASIPQTAYLKLVDVWFVFCIISLFLVVVTVAFINWVRKCAPSILLRAKGSARRTQKEAVGARRVALAAWLNLLCRLVCPILTTLFLVFYLTMAALIEIPKLDITLVQ
ncbi:hypothetical protein O3P69_004770 [Scylla paramamosain]|uniref:Uncharacterized protein n=1 Tax=Scylla paramamosain TaxID=85552 RepID=A0AAW0UDI4_SCYPA